MDKGDGFSFTETSVSFDHYFEMIMENGGFKCDFVMDDNLIAKEVSPCFMEEFDGEFSFKNYYGNGDTTWYSWGNHDLEVTCTVTDSKETTNAQREICGSVLGIEWSFANTDKTIFWYEHSAALRFASKIYWLLVPA